MLERRKQGAGGGHTHTHTHTHTRPCVFSRLKEKTSPGMYIRWSEDVMEVRGACCSVMLMGTMEPRCYQMREITAMALLFSDWSGCVNLLALIGPRRRKTKSMFRSKASFNFQSRCSQMSFLSSEASASAVKLFSAMTGECMCSLLSSLKAKCLVWPLSSCVTACAVLF